MMTNLKISDTSCRRPLSPCPYAPFPQNEGAGPRAGVTGSMNGTYS